MMTRETLEGFDNFASESDVESRDPLVDGTALAASTPRQAGHRLLSLQTLINFDLWICRL